MYIIYNKHPVVCKLGFTGRNSRPKINEIIHDVKYFFHNQNTHYDIVFDSICQCNKNA